MPQSIANLACVLHDVWAQEKQRLPPPDPARVRAYFDHVAQETDLMRQRYELAQEQRLTRLAMTEQERYIDALERELCIGPYAHLHLETP